MSVDYATGLSEYKNKGVCGLPEVKKKHSPYFQSLALYIMSRAMNQIDAFALIQEFDAPDKLAEKIRVLVELLSSANHAVVYTGAGISTAAGLY